MHRFDEVRVHLIHFTHDAFEEAALVALERARAGRPNRTAKLLNGELGTHMGPSFSKIRSLQPFAPTLPSLGPDIPQ
jgi:hypothetical protein